MDNLSELKELDIVPLHQIEAIKEDKTSRVTIIEYQSSQVAVIDNTLLISTESQEKYYPLCLEILKAFRLRTSKYLNQATKKMLSFKAINTKFRNSFLNCCRTEKHGSVSKMVEMVGQIKEGHAYEEG
jgi:hypothetical protein